jgi:diguanylate cyclase (GGDEF)-like protein
MLHLQETMLEISNLMTKIKSLDELLNLILQKIIEVIPGAEFGSILVMNSNGKLEFKAIKGFDTELFHITLDPTECYQWRVTSGNFIEPIIIQDLSILSKDYMREDTYTTLSEIDALTTKSAISAPLLLDGKFFGSINIDSTSTNAFQAADIKLMAYFANQVTMAIKNHQYYEKILFASNYDGLTKAMNRNHFQEYMLSFLADGADEKTPFTIVIMDLNDFKMINDQYGHTRGDSILAHFAKNFSAQLSATDLFARYGGDEFVAVFFNSNLEETAQNMRVIHNTIATTAVKLSVDDSEVRCQFSYGISEYPVDGTSLKSLIHVADQRMYVHKNTLKINTKEL